MSYLLSTLNFLFPIPGTPLENAPRLRPMEILKIIAVMRLILPRQDLKVAGGREKNLRDLQSWIFYVGGTSGLIGNYLATAGRPNRDDLQVIRIDVLPRDALHIVSIDGHDLRRVGVPIVRRETINLPDNRISQQFRRAFQRQRE